MRFGEGFVGSDGDGILFFPFGQHLKEHLSASLVEFHVTEFVEQKEIHSPVTGDGFSELFLIRGFDELVHQPGGEDVFDAVASFGGRGSEPDKEMRFPGPGVPDQTQRLALADPVAGGEGSDGGGIDIGVGIEIEVGQPLFARETSSLDPPHHTSPVTVVAFGKQQLRQKSVVRQLILACCSGGILDDGTNGGQP